MRYTAEEFAKKYGQEALNMTNAVSGYKAPQQPGFLSRFSNVMQGAQQQQGDIATQAAQGKIGGAEAGLQTAGNVAKTITGGVMALPGVSQVAGAIGSGVEAARGLAQKGAEAVFSALPEDFKASHKLAPQDVAAGKPIYERASKNTQAFADVADLLLTAEGGVEGVKGVAEGAKGVANVAGKVGDVASEAAGKATDVIKGMKTPKDTVSELVSPKLTGKALEKAIKTGKVTEAQGLGKRDFSKTVPSLDEMKSVLGEVPGIQDIKTNLEASNLVKQFNDNLHTTLMDKLSQEKAFSNPSAVKSRMEEVRQTLNENPTMVGDASSAGEKIISKFEKLVDEHGYTGEGVMKARIALDKWAGAAKKFSSAAENGATEALRAVRDAANNIAAELSPNTATKELLRKQTMLHRAQDIIARKAAGEGNTKVQQFMKKHPVMTKAAKIATGGTIAGKAARLAE